MVGSQKEHAGRHRAVSFPPYERHVVPRLRLFPQKLRGNECCATAATKKKRVIIRGQQSDDKRLRARARHPEAKPSFFIYATRHCVLRLNRGKTKRLPCVRGWHPETENNVLDFCVAARGVPRDTQETGSRR